MRTVSTGIQEGIHFQKSDLSIVLDTRSQLNTNGVTRTRTLKYFRTRDNQARRTFMPDRDQSGQRFKKDFLFRSKATADPGFDHADLLQRIIAGLGNDTADMEGNLRGRYNNQAAHFIEHGFDRVRLDRAMLSVVRPIRFIDNKIRFGFALFHIPKADLDLCSQILFGFIFGTNGIRVRCIV